MIEVTDEDIAEALRLSAHNYSNRSIQDFRESGQDEFGHAREILAILHKLRVAVEALERVNKLPPCDGGTENARASQDMRNTEVARLIARQALTQIKDTGQ